jgi:hypothetical protein
MWGLGWGGGDGTKNDFGNSKKAKAKTQQKKKPLKPRESHHPIESLL